MISSIPPRISIEDQITALHDNLRAEIAGVVRMAVAVYDAKTDALKTFVNSTEGGSPLVHYEAKLAEVPSLAELAEGRRDRVVDDLSIFEDSATEHSQILLQRYGSSYTKPLYEDDHLRGFVFFDAVDRGFFTPSVVQRLSIYADLVGLLVAKSLFPAKILRSVVEVTSQVTHVRDPETGAHLDRMTRYARIITLALADEEQLTDSFVEYLFLFAPLHDIGKVGIPDSVLLKPGRLTEAEFEIMKTHVVRGTDMIERVLGDVGVEGLPHVSMLRNVVRHHHEAWDGSGYPDGLAGSSIPLEARIVTVADVFDALTSERPYKKAWSFDDAYAHLQEQAGKRFDARCVRALVDAAEEARSIRERFKDAPPAVHREGYSDEL